MSTMRPSLLITWAAVLVLFLGFRLPWAFCDSTVDLIPLKACFEAQNDLKSISADFTQTRALKTLKSPIAVKGHFWFAAPDRFRWQLGDPPKTIIIGAKEGNMVIHPSTKHAEKSTLTTSGSFPSQKVFEMMGLSGKRTLEEFQKHMNVLSLKTSGTRCHLEMLPKDPAASRGLSSINLDFDAGSGQWIGFEIVTREGSLIRTELNNVRTNSVIPGGVFDYDLRGFTVDHEKK